VDNIRTDLGKIGWSSMNFIGLAQEKNKWRALVKVVINLEVP
jgi:hypothetical protein